MVRRARDPVPSDARRLTPRDDAAPALTGGGGASVSEVRVGGARYGLVMNDYSRAWDSLTQAIGAAKGKSAGYFDDVEHLTIDQRLKVAEVAALLSIAQELSGIRHGGIAPEYQPD